MTTQPTARVAGDHFAASPVPLTRAEVMHAADVAALLAIPLSTVHEWARRGVLPSRKRGRHRLFLRGEVQQWLEAADES